MTEQGVWPDGWRGREKTGLTRQIVNGRFLMRDDFSGYKISAASKCVDASRGASGSYAIDKETLEWKCSKCGTYNHYVQNICSGCHGKIIRRGG